MTTKSDMEFWTEIFKGKIPKDNYSASMNVRDTDWGNTIMLKGENNEFIVYFRSQLEVRSFSRNLAVNKLFLANNIDQYALDDFSNVLYEVNNSQLKKDFEFRGFMDENSSQFSHFVIVAENIILDILSFGKTTKLYATKLNGIKLEKTLVCYYRDSD